MLTLETQLQLLKGLPCILVVRIFQHCIKPMLFRGWTIPNRCCIWTKTTTRYRTTTAAWTYCTKTVERKFYTLLTQVENSSLRASKGDGNKQMQKWKLKRRNGTHVQAQVKRIYRGISLSFLDLLLISLQCCIQSINITIFWWERRRAFTLPWWNDRGFTNVFLVSFSRKIVSCNTTQSEPRWTSAQYRV